MSLTLDHAPSRVERETPLLERILTGPRGRPMRRSARYAMSPVLVGLNLIPVLIAPGAGLLDVLLYQAILLTALIAGRGPGIAALLLSGTLIVLGVTGADAGGTGSLAATTAFIVVAAVGALAASSLRLTLHRSRRLASGLASRSGELLAQQADRASCEEEWRTVNGELAHRLRNLVALAQAIVNHTLSAPADLASIKVTLLDRLAALGAAAQVLTHGCTTGSDIRSIALGALEAHRAGGSRIKIGGPFVELPARLSLGLALALHELATNAAKYGALSNDAGTVTLNWSVSYRDAAQDGAGRPRLNLEWVENDGPPVAPPVCQGFGTKLIQRTVSSYFEGSAQIRFDVEGVRFILQAPLPAADAQDQAIQKFQEVV